MKNAKWSVLYKNIIQVENKNVGLKVCVCVGGGGHKHTIAPPPQSNKVCPPCHPPPPHASYASDVFEQNCDWQSERNLKAMNVNVVFFSPPPSTLVLTFSVNKQYYELIRIIFSQLNDVLKL